ncbi:DEAD/DEAH box helicase [Streptomyces sp. NBC_00038]|uniref:DEAD/DEAH box helicase n=1 Tax=Streptomyces sp. NBC_00038 TaxID=2903615 RepID=UPI00224EF880|nr:DEAD/DEAH box helicase [Streptomyces sp. NBC_00038]MCX5563652.1 Helicase associated domain protein [Streptomyces sp. NBC_00038]
MTSSPTTAEHTARLVLRTDQQEGLTSTVRHLRRPRTRGHAVSACGTGKTLFALRVAEELGVRHLAVAVPSLDLIAQWAAAARADGRHEPMITVSSLNAASHPLLAEAKVDSTNAGEYLAYWLGRHKTATVFFTYDSLSKIEETQHSAIFPAPVFNLLIVDEAHATAGTWEKNWTALHDNNRIPAERRLYLTATPYVWEAPRLTEPPTTGPQPKRTTATAPAWDDPSLLATMDQPQIFGPRLHTYSHADAIDDGVLADYQLLVPTITDTELRTALTDPQAGPTARRTTALHLAILKAIREQDLRHVFVYFQQIADAADFATQFAHTLRTLPTELRPDWADEIVVQSIDGTHNPHQRADIIARFTNADRGLLANAKVLGEGVDLPAVDGIVFADRTTSVRRIVQALGRALRKPPTLKTKTASLVIPAYIPPGADPTDLLGTPYEALWLVTAALRHHDQTIAARAPRGKHQHPAHDTHTYITHRFRFDHTLDPSAIARALNLLAWPSNGAVLSAPRRAGLAAAIRYHTEHAHLRVPSDYEDAYGYRLGSFITGQRTAYQAGALDEPWTAELDTLGMIWDDHEAAWQGHMATVEAYHAEHGHLAIPAQAPGGQFLVDQRALARKDRLTADRNAQLTALDPDWKLPNGPDWHRKYHLLRRHLEAGNHPSTLRRDTVIHGVKAGSWLHRQFTTWPTLDPGRRDLLARIGLTPDRVTLDQEGTAGTSRRRTFAQTAEILQLFVRRWGRTPGAREWIEVDGERVMIGPWLAKARTKLNASQLPTSQAELLSATLAEHDIDPGPAPDHGTTPLLPGAGRREDRPTPQDARPDRRDGR